MSSSVQSESPRSSSSESLSSRNDETVSLEAKMAINIVLNRFFLSNDVKELEFPTSFSSNERVYVHTLCQMNDLISTTKGKGIKKYVHVTKKNEVQYVPNEATLSFSAASSILLQSHSKNYSSLTAKEKEELTPKIRKQNNNQVYEFYQKLYSFGTVTPQVPRIALRNESDCVKYPINAFRQEILNVISLNKIVSIVGDPGLGKTTQISQFILDYSQKVEQNCRIIHSQPNDLIAFSAACRVAKERGVHLGQVIGCHIGHNLKITSSSSLLTFCSNKILLKNLMGSSNESDNMSTVTHIILDEVDLRDRHADFVLILLKDLMIKYRNLKLILIGSGSNGDTFQKFFGQHPTFIVPHRATANVQEYFLEDVIKLTDFLKDEVSKKPGGDEHLLEKWCIENRKKSYFRGLDQNEPHDQENMPPESSKPGSIAKLADNLLMSSWIDGRKASFNNLLNLVQTNKLDVNYQHSETGVTSLMAAAISGYINIVEKLISLGANVHLKACNDLTALDWAKRFSKTETVELLDCYQNLDIGASINFQEFSIEKELSVVGDTMGSKQIEDHHLLRSYYRQSASIPAWVINPNLVIALLIRTLETNKDGSILIFLPNFYEMVKFSECLNKNKAFNDSKIKTAFIHKEMSLSDLESLYENEDRKIILTTNVYENLVPLRYVSTVIDCGINQEIFHDATSNSPAKKCAWISKYSANCRKTKALYSKNLRCFRLFSKHKFKSLPSQPVAQILSYPLQEICMMSKEVVPFNTSITDLISKAPDSPPFFQLRNSINYLKSIDALDTWEDMTELGVHLVNFGLDLKLGKMIFYSLVLKCLNPIMVIVAALSTQDPFDSNIDSKKYSEFLKIKKKWSENVFSDHIVIYRVYQAWRKAKNENNELDFCTKNFINSSVMARIESFKLRLISYLQTFGFIKSFGNGDLATLNTNSENLNSIKSVLVAALYPNAIRIDKKNKRLLNDKETKIKISAHSSLWSDLSSENLDKLSHDWLVFDEWQQFGNVQFIKRGTLVSSHLVCLFAGPVKLNEKSLRATESSKQTIDGIDYESLFKIDSWIEFHMTKESFESVLTMKQKFNLSVLRFIQLNQFAANEIDTVNALMTVIKNEESTSRVIKIDADKTNKSVEFYFSLAFRTPSVLDDKYFVSHVFADEAKIQELSKKEVVVGKNCSSQDTITRFLEKSKKDIYVILINPEKPACLGYCKLSMLPSGKSKSATSVSFEHDDKNSLIQLKVFKRDQSTENPENFSHSVNLKDLLDGQEIDQTVGRKLIKSI